MPQELQLAVAYISDEHQHFTASKKCGNKNRSWLQRHMFVYQQKTACKTSGNCNSDCQQVERQTGSIDQIHLIVDQLSELGGSDQGLDPEPGLQDL